MNEREDQEQLPHVDSLSTKLTYLLIGGSIGAALVLLLAPKPGAETRGNLTDATRRIFERAREKASTARHGESMDASSGLGGDETKGDYEIG